MLLALEIWAAEETEAGGAKSSIRVTLDGSMVNTLEKMGIAHNSIIMTYFKILVLFCFSIHNIYAKNTPDSKIQQINITQKMLQGRVLQTIEYGEDLRMKFFPSKQKLLDGDIVFHFNTNEESDNEVLNYKLDDGQIVYYSNDGSIYRLKLISATSTTWIMLEYQDIDGDGTIFSFGEPSSREYGIVNTKNNQMQDLPSVLTFDNYDMLYMDVYGRKDVSIASAKEYLDQVNNFLRISSQLLIEKYKVKIKLHKIKQNPYNLGHTSPEYAKLKDELDFIDNFYGRTLTDYEGNKLSTMEELKSSFDEAAKISRQYQEHIYFMEEDRNKALVRLEAFLDKSGTEEQKRLIKKYEIEGLKIDYEYFRSLLNNSSVFCLHDQSMPQKIPLFYPKPFIIERLYEKYWMEISRSKKPYDADELFSRVKRIESESKRLKKQFILNRLDSIKANLNKRELKY